MLEDVRDACGVSRHCGKENAEGVVVVFGLDVDVPGAGAVVLELEVGAVEPVERLPAADGIAADRFDGGVSCLCHERLSLGCVC